MRDLGNTHIDRLIADHKILITCGTGGVGKTTLSAAIAVRAAMQGRKTVVITIDPAKRLATSLGMAELGDTPQNLTDNLKLAAARAHLPEVKGQLSALMPDTRRTFENFVHKMAPNPALAERVIANPIFQIFAREFSGTNEYMAMERLYRLTTSGEYDFVVLDTPPSRNTLAFLDAPRMLSEFFDDKIIKWLVVPTNKLVAVGMKKALGMLEKLTGAGFMGDLLEFASALFEVRENFQRNLAKVMDLLRSDSVGFLLVASASPTAAPEAAHFIRSVREHQFHFSGVALNRTLGYLKLTSEQRTQAESEEGLRPAIEILDALQVREKAAIQALEGHLSLAEGSLKLQLPELARDVHSLSDLLRVAEALGVNG
jgi:anion-transporting  ArsA/GET3 family ATPase